MLCFTAAATEPVPVTREFIDLVPAKNSCFRCSIEEGMYVFKLNFYFSGGGRRRLSTLPGVQCCPEVTQGIDLY